MVLATTPQYDGFFEAVDGLRGDRAATVYAHIIAFWSLFVLVCVRMYFSKLRKKGRQGHFLRPLFALIPKLATGVHECTCVNVCVKHLDGVLIPTACVCVFVLVYIPFMMSLLSHSLSLYI
jgi:hypothetical protein